MSDLLQQLLGVVAALVAVLALAWGAIWLMKRFQLGGAPGATQDLRFVRALPLGPRERLVVVEWRGEILLLGVTAGGVSLLDRRVAAGCEQAESQRAPAGVNPS